MTTLRPLRGGSPAFEVIVDGVDVALVTMARPSAAYVVLAPPRSEGQLWHVYMFGRWRLVEPNRQALYVGSHDRLAAAVDEAEYLHARRPWCRHCGELDCPHNEP